MYASGNSRCQCAAVRIVGDHSPSAALTGAFLPTAAITAETVSWCAMPSGPRVGSLTSIRSAPAASAAVAQATGGGTWNFPAWTSTTPRVVVGQVRTSTVFTPAAKRAAQGCLTDSACRTTGMGDCGGNGILTPETKAAAPLTDWAVLR